MFVLYMDLKVTSLNVRSKVDIGVGKAAVPVRILLNVAAHQMELITPITVEHIPYWGEAM